MNNFSPLSPCDSKCELEMGVMRFGAHCKYSTSEYIGNYIIKA